MTTYTKDLTKTQTYGNSFCEYKVYQYLLNLQSNTHTKEVYSQVYEVNSDYVTMEKLNVDYQNLSVDIRKQLNYEYISSELDKIGIYHGDFRHHNFGWSEIDQMWKIYDFASSGIFKGDDWIMVPSPNIFSDENILPSQYNNYYIDYNDICEVFNQFNYSDPYTDPEYSY